MADLVALLLSLLFAEYIHHGLRLQQSRLQIVLGSSLILMLRIIHMKTQTCFYSQFLELTPSSCDVPKPVFCACWSHAVVFMLFFLMHLHLQIPILLQMLLYPVLLLLLEAATML